MENTGDMAEGLTTAVDFQKASVTDLNMQGTQMVLALGMTIVITQVVQMFHAFMELEYSLLFS
jgi:hypothetical protein